MNEEKQTENFDCSDVLMSTIVPLAEKIYDLCIEHDLPMFIAFASSRNDVKAQFVSWCVNDIKNRYSSKIDQMAGILIDAESLIKQEDQSLH